MRTSTALRALEPNNRRWIEAALAREHHGLCTLRDVLEMLLSGRAHLWSDTEACVVTTINTYPQGKVWVVWLAGGKLESVLKLSEGFHRAALAHDCRVVEIHGRRGWERVLRSRGFKAEKVLLSRDIPPLPDDEDKA